MPGSAASVSVITVTHARRDLLLEKAETMAAQTLPRHVFEWIVLVNGAEDDSLSALDAWHKEHSELKLTLLQADPSVGIGAARNRAVTAAEGTIVVLSDDDCLLQPNTLERHLSAQRDVPAMWLGPIVFQAPERVERWLPAPKWWQLNGANASIPTAAYRNVGGFDETIEGYGGEDLLLGYALHRSGLTCRVLKDAVVTHVGPNPIWGGDAGKAYRAGHNAAAIAERMPELAFRLGVHPTLMAVKRVLYGAPWSTWLERIAGGRFRYERAYFTGASERRESRKS